MCLYAFSLTLKTFKVTVKNSDLIGTRSQSIEEFIVFKSKIIKNCSYNMCMIEHSLCTMVLQSVRMENMVRTVQKLAVFIVLVLEKNVALTMARVNRAVSLGSILHSVIKVYI